MGQGSGCESPEIGPKHLQYTIELANEYRFRPEWVSHILTVGIQTIRNKHIGDLKELKELK